MSSGASFSPVLTKAYLARQKQNNLEKFEPVVFEEFNSRSNNAANIIPTSPQREIYKRNNTNTMSAKDTLKSNEFDIKKARNEVLNFAIQNQRIVKNQKKMQVFQAISLGAKPPKKTNKNYKELLNERKRLQTIREERKKFHQIGKNQTGAASVKCRSKSKLEGTKKKRIPVADIDKHYGVANTNFKNKK